MFLKSMRKSETMTVVFLIFIVILLRLPIFFLSHNNNDELIYLSLASKIDSYGFNVFKDTQYNLWYVEKGFDPVNEIVAIFFSENKIGSLLKGFFGEDFRMSHHPPTLSFLIFISHTTCAHQMDYLVNVSENIYVMARNFSFQFYACIVPFVFSALLLIATYILGRLFFSHAVGLMGAFFLGITPAELMAANKIWADDMTAFFVAASVILYLLALDKKRPTFAFVAGLSCGISIITKMSGVYLIFIVMIFHFLRHVNERVNARNLKNFFLDKNVLYFLAGAFIVSAWWLDLYFSHYSLKGMKGYFAVNQTWGAVKTFSGFYSRISNRPWFAYFVLTPAQSPFFALSYIFIIFFILRNKIKSVSSLISGSCRYVQFFIIWMTVTLVLLMMMPGKEMRYLLIACPAIALLSSQCFVLFYEWLKTKENEVSPLLRETLVVSFVVLSLFFSLKIALPVIFYRSDVIAFPF